MALSMPSDHFEKMIRNIIEEMCIKDYTITVTRGSECGDNFMGEIFRVQIVGTKCLTLIVKNAPSNLIFRNSIGINEVYTRECFVYSKLHPAMKELQDKYIADDKDKYSFAKMYKCCCEELRETLIFEDLSAEGFVMFDRYLSFDYVHMVVCIEDLAKFHAASIALKDQREDVYEETSGMCCDSRKLKDVFKRYIDAGRAAVLEACEHKHYRDKFMAFYDNMHLELIRCLTTSTTAPYNVICHGDYWSSNLLFKYEDSKLIKMIMLDFQFIKDATPITDLSYVFFLGLNKHMRDKYYKEMLKLYYKILSRNVTMMNTDIDKYYPETVYWDHVKKYMKIGWIWTVIILPFRLGDKEKFENNEDLAKKVSGFEPIALTEFGLERLKELIEDCFQYGVL